MVAVTVIKKISLSRYLHQLAIRELKSKSELNQYAGVNILHDAVEAFLLGVAEHVDGKVSANTKFEQYLDIIDDKMSPNRLPFRSKLLRLNRLRIDSKHYAIRPDQSETNELLLAVKEFFDEVAESVLKANFDTVSLVDLLDDGDAKEMLKQAEKDLGDGLYAECLISCRKALFLEVERKYDVGPFQKGLVGPNKTIAFYLSSAPSHAKSKDYIAEFVREPTDLIVFDDDSLHKDLMRFRIDPTEFWNVWRLTPKVYLMSDKSWAVSREFAKLDREDVPEKAQYVFPATVNMILSIHLQKRGVMSVPDQTWRIVFLKKDEVPVYEKARRSDTNQELTPKGMRTFFSDRCVTGLDGGCYWHILADPKKNLLVGYIHDGDVQATAYTPEEIKALLGVKKNLADTVEPEDQGGQTEHNDKPKPRNE